jgi:hypothetical protein
VARAVRDAGGYGVTSAILAGDAGGTPSEQP